MICIVEWSLFGDVRFDVGMIFIELFCKDKDGLFLRLCWGFRKLFVVVMWSRIVWKKYFNLMEEFYGVLNGLRCGFVNGGLILGFKD